MDTFYGRRESSPILLQREERENADSEDDLPFEKSVWTTSLQMKQFFLTFIVASATFTEGIVSAWPSSNIKSVVEEFNLLQDQSAWIVSIVSLGYVTGCICYGPMANLIGRNLSFVIADVISIIGFIILISSRNIDILYLAQFIVGYGVSILEINTFVYITEVMFYKFRARFCVLAEFLLLSGRLFNALLGQFILNWRIRTVLCIIPCIINIIAMLLLPESTRWLLMHNKNEKARLSIAWFHQTDNDEFINAVMTNIQSTEEEQSTQRLQFSDLKKKIIILPLIYTIILEILRKMLYMDTFVAYASEAFKNVFSFENIYVMPIVFQATMLIGFLLSFYPSDKYGRRILLNVSAISMCMISILFGVNLSYRLLSEWINVILLITLTLAFTIGWAVLPKVVYAEINTDKVRSLAFGLQGTVGRTVLFLLNLYFLDMIEAFSMGGILIIIAIVAFVSFMYVYILIPETFNRKTEDIQMMFENNIIQF